MTDVIIREAGTEDLAALEVLEQNLIAAERPFDPTIRPSPVTYYNLKRMLEDDAYYVLVAEKEGEIISSGYGVGKPARPYLDHMEYAYLGFMYTVPEYRGCGINGRIIAELKKWAAKQGFKEIRLTVYVENIPAIKAYKKAGFEEHLIEMRVRH